MNNALPGRTSIGAETSAAPGVLLRLLPMLLLLTCLAAAPPEPPAGIRPLATAGARPAASPPGAGAAGGSRAEMLQFTAGGHVIAFAPGKVIAAGGDHLWILELAGAASARPVAAGTPPEPAGSTKLSRPENQAERNAGTAIAAPPGAPSLQQVSYPEAWPGITVEFTSLAGAILKSTYRLAAGTPVDRVRLRYNRPATLDDAGRLVLGYGHGAMTEAAPTAWQDIGGRRRPVPARFRLDADGTVGFSVGAHDPAQPLVIDPALTWNTFLGGANGPGTHYGQGMAMNLDGNYFVVGTSDCSWGTPVQAHSGHTDVFVAKLDENGNLLWHTFMGSASGDYGEGISVDGNGYSHVTGSSDASWGTPVRAFQAGWDAFAAKLDGSGYLVWHTFLGGASLDYGQGIAVDGSGNCHVVGDSQATWESPVRSHSGGEDAFVARLNANGGLLWNTFLGSADSEYGRGIAADGSGNSLVAGYGRATWETPVRAHSGGWDAFAAKLGDSGNLLWHTFLGSSAEDHGYEIDVDGSGNSYVTGHSLATWETPVRAHAGGADAFAARLDDEGNLDWLTFLGSSDTDCGYGIAVHGSGAVHLTGYSKATWGTPVGAHSGQEDGFAAQLDGSGNLVWHAFLGGDGADYGCGIVVDGAGASHVAGYSPTGWGTPVRPFSGGQDAFAVKLDGSGNLSWNSFLGGATHPGIHECLAIARDGAGNIFVTGHSSCTWGTPRRDHEGLVDAFAAKLDESGTLLWNTFLGSSTGNSKGTGIAVDGTGEIYVTGHSHASWGSPVRAGSYAPDAFAAKLDGSGNLIWNTFLGSLSQDFGTGIAVDGSGHCYVAGNSQLTWETPVRPHSGLVDAFAAKLDSAGALLWHTFLGSSSNDYGNGIAADGTGKVHVVGSSEATWETPVRSHSGGTDAFVAKLDSSGDLLWNTFLGGDNQDAGFGLAVDGSANSLVTGGSDASWGSPVRSHSGSSDIFAARLDETGQLVWNTFLGGGGLDYSRGIALDGTGHSYVTGFSDASWGSPARGHAGGLDSCAARLDGGGALVWNTFLGGTGNDIGYGVVADGGEHCYVAGSSTAAWELPVRDFPGSQDGFVACLSNYWGASTALAADPSPACAGESVGLTATVSGPAGTPTGTVTFRDGAAILGTETLSGGTAQLDTSLLETGTRYLTAAYSGDTVYSGSTSPVVPLTVYALPNPSISGPSLVCLGSAVTLDAGAGYAAYLWSTAETTRTIEVAPAVETGYTVEVTDGNGCTASSPTHTVTVEQPPDITANPGDASVAPGGAALLAVTATGSPVLHYQWYQGPAGDTSTPAGTDSASLDTGALFLTTSFWVRVSNGCGSDASTAAIVSIDCPPLPSPALDVPAEASSGADYTVSWTDVLPGGSYELQEADNPFFTAPSSWVTPDNSRLCNQIAAAPAYFYYRVRSTQPCDGSDHFSAWSGIQHVCVNCASGPPGDTNGNGTIDAPDAVLLAQYLAGTLDTIGPADLDGDGLVTLGDLSLLVQLVSGNL